MRLITWNCQGAFRNKAENILSFNPDILVVQECEHPDKMDFNSMNIKPNNFYWHGDNLHKGVGVYSYSGYKFDLLPSFNPEFRYILPFKVTGRNHAFTLFVIWAMGNKDNYKARYIGQVWQAINHYVNLLDNSTILIGDFNSNKIWDYKPRVGTHSDVVNKLAGYNIQSVYHHYYNSEQGMEEHPTFFLQRCKNKPFHIDYCFASANIIRKLTNLEIGTYEDWGQKSDHSPMIIDFDL